MFGAPRFLRGAKPSKQNFSDGRPDTASAVVTADGPGRHCTGRPGVHARHDQPIARVADQRHPGVADHQHRRTGFDRVDQGGPPARPRPGRTG